MGCLGIVVLFLAVFAYFMYAVGILIIADIVVLILFLLSLYRWSKLWGVVPSSMVCPNCKSNNSKLSTRASGVSASSHIFGAFINAGASINYDRIATCQDCGFTWNYITNGDIIAAKSKAKIRTIILGIIVLICGIISWYVYDGFFADKKEEDYSDGQNVWSEEYTDISEFDYYIDGNQIYLTDFDSDEKKVRIAPSYEIDGNTYYVGALNGAFAVDNVLSVIIPEGVKSIAANEFNSCDVKFIYLPSTLQDVGGDMFWDYLFEVEKIYYGGTEQQWNMLCRVDRSTIDVKQIICNANPDELR